MDTLAGQGTAHILPFFHTRMARNTHNLDSWYKLSFVALPTLKARICGYNKTIIASCWYHPPL